MFQLWQLKIFLAAAETLSFTRAAKQVHLSQPSVTEQVRALEQSVGQPLFIRKNNRLMLTAAGERLAGRARELLAMADDTFRVVRDNPDEKGGTIRVAAPQTLCTCLLIPVLTRFVELHPRTRVEIRERNSSETAQAVLGGTADLGLVHGWPANDANLQADLVARDMPVVVMPPGHPLSRAADVKPDALAAFPLIVTMEGCRYREYLDALLQEAPVRPCIRGVADSVQALVQMVSAGLGVSILPRMAVDTAETALRVELRALSTIGEGLPICLLTVGREPTRHVAAFIEMIRLAVARSDEPMSTVDVKNRAGRVAVTK
ncbi:LysR family transcriptional regulator [Paraburkholderia caffeinilytica]|uniref:LysR family transcriptional regulator n=1 Tax=Paraburkholderia caffeinilytica TaxID=1761016 RepID=A0ABQ1LQP5_9BURK|nr:LysR family transcriptional regulator [Paraburkholderia caffeinilytica]GGC27375.1 LysR family transcriptional regulator [Paraburkholderia caffeinilytica]CAB3780241.1 HTH-type transcriptional regulator HdfR [Paraburkholderia caffeinilytica]